MSGLGRLLFVVSLALLLIGVWHHDVIELVCAWVLLWAGAISQDRRNRGI